MTQAVITVDVAVVEAQIAKLMFALAPMELLGWMKEVVEPYIQQRAQSRFASEGDEVSGKWAPLSDATINIRTTGQIDYGAGPINVRTGGLAEYITESSGQYAASGGDAVMVYPGNAATGTLEAKMIAAQQGLADPRTPPRPVIGVNERDLAAVLTELEFYIMSI